MKIKLNDIINNSYDRSMKKLILIYDDNGECETYRVSNIPNHVKQMNIERYGIVSGKLTVIKVVGVISDK